MGRRTVAAVTALAVAVAVVLVAWCGRSRGESE